MSVFEQKLKQFMSNPWDSQIDISLNNQLIKQKNKMFNDQAGAQAFIKDFIDKNQMLVAQASQKFQDEIGQLPTYITESEYNGVWDTISMLIRKKDGSDIDPTTIMNIKRFAKQKYNIVVRSDIEYPKAVLIVPNFKMADGYIKFEKLLQKIDPDLKTDITTLPTTKHNKASQVNKLNAEKEKIKLQQPEHNYVMENKEILLPTVKEVYGKVVDMLTEANIAFETVSLNKFVERNFKKVKSICESATSSIDTMRLYALMEATDLQEMTTADINVPQMAVGSSIMRKRLQGFDPFGKNLANTSEGTKTVIKMDSDVLQESVKKLNFEKTVIIGTDIETSSKYSRVILESESKKQELVIDRNEFLNFLKRNADVRNYMEEGKLNVGKYFESRTNAFIGTVIKEYLKTLITESSNEGFKIDDVSLKDGFLTVVYYYESDVESRVAKIPEDKFIDYVETKYDTDDFYTHDRDDVSMENVRGSYNFDVNAFWDSFTYPEQLRIVKDFLDSTGAIGNNGEVMNESKKNKLVINDFNLWKDLVATESNNDFEINEGIAKDTKGKLLGEWNRDGKKGYIYISNPGFAK